MRGWIDCRSMSHELRCGKGGGCGEGPSVVGHIVVACIY